MRFGVTCSCRPEPRAILDYLGGPARAGLALSDRDVSTMLDHNQMKSVLPNSCAQFLVGLVRLWVLLCLAFAAQAGAPGTNPIQYDSHLWQTDDGLPQNSVRAITQTPDG